MTRLKGILLFIHRWLGFISGLVVFIVSITGCLFAFQDEIQDIFCSYRKVMVQQKPYLPPSQLKKIALKYYPKGTGSMMAYYGPNRPALVLLTSPNTGTRYIYLNPYTGKYLYDEDINSNFFVVVKYIHLYLLLPPNIGKKVVSYSVLIFLVMLLSGIMLWWPKRKADRKRSFTIKWNGHWRAVNYDLHTVLGFYACGIAFILALTGLSISFSGMEREIYKTANMGKIYPLDKDNSRSGPSPIAFKSNLAVADRAFVMAKLQSPWAKMFFIIEGDGKKDHTTLVTAYYKSMHFYKSDNYTFDQYSGKQLRRLSHQKKSPGLKMNQANYDIHVGQILDLPGKILAFLASLICASLPITGCMLWLGKRQKQKGIRT